jgi:Protein of unknown function (DUF1553)/Protein of unknown function (DUF1549)
LHSTYPTSTTFLAPVVCWILAGAICAFGADSHSVSFRNDVIAVLSKAGCNSGTCHGNKNGKGGFKLSLRGQDPELDYVAITGDLSSRRVDPVDPAGSLVLLKPSTTVPHEGGLRLPQNSEVYDLVFRWIGQRFPSDLGSGPSLKRLTVDPENRILVEPERRVRLRVQAEFSNGEVRDVSKLAVYEPVNRVVEVAPDGSVQNLQSGETTILVRYLSAQVPVRLAFVPNRAIPQFATPNNYIDTEIFAKLRLLRIAPSSVCIDEVFVRRAYLDLLGILPAPEEARQFVNSERRSKRKELVNQLLERPEFADFWALKWADLLRVEAHSLDEKGVQAFHHWVRSGIAANKPVDQVVRELILARGSTYANPAANYYRPIRDAAGRGKATAQVFLGARIQCAECHNHPSDRWTQNDYYDWAALFAPISYKVIQNNRDISTDEHEWKGEQVIFLRPGATINNPRTGKVARPRVLGNAETVSADDYPQALANWLTSPTNRLFARVQANRIWYHLMGRGLVDPPDDFRATNPASHPELLDALADDFVRHRFDMRNLIRVIMNSRAYQLSSEPTAFNETDEINYSHVNVRRLGAEQLLDSQSQVAEVPLKFTGFPAGLRAAQLPGVRPESKGKRRAYASDQFLELFGKPPRLLSTDTERSCECNMAQAFQMIGGPTVVQLLSEQQNCLSRLLKSGMTPRGILDELFWKILTRAPTPGEVAALLPAIESGKNPRAELEDVTWALLNSKEFLFRR